MMKIIGAAVICAVVSYVLSELGFRAKRAVSLICIILMFIMISEGVGRLIGETLGFADMAGIGDAAVTAVKIIGVGYIFGICSDIISELGEPSVAKGLVAVGRIEVLCLILPYFKDIITLGIGLIK